MPSKIALKFSREKETPNTVRFAEGGEKEDHTVGTLYVKKSSEFSKEENLTVTIEAK